MIGEIIERNYRLCAKFEDGTIIDMPPYKYFNCCPGM